MKHEKKNYFIFISSILLAISCQKAENTPVPKRLKQMRLESFNPKGIYINDYSYSEKGVLEKEANRTFYEGKADTIRSIKTYTYTPNLVKTTTIYEGNTKSYVWFYHLNKQGLVRFDSSARVDYLNYYTYDNQNHEIKREQLPKTGGSAYYTIDYTYQDDKEMGSKVVSISKTDNKKTIIEIQYQYDKQILDTTSDLYKNIYFTGVPSKYHYTGYTETTTIYKLSTNEMLSSETSVGKFNYVLDSDGFIISYPTSGSRITYVYEKQ